MTLHWQDEDQVRDDPALAALLSRLAERGTQPVDDATRARTIDAMATTAASVHASPTGSPWGRRGRRLATLTGAKLVLAASVAAATTTGGLAATGNLPAPAQQVVHELGQRIGIGVPAAPGQVAGTSDDPSDTGRDHAPGRVARTTPEDDARDVAPGRAGRAGGTPGPSSEVPGPPATVPNGPPDGVTDAPVADVPAPSPPVSERPDPQPAPPTPGPTSSETEPPEDDPGPTRTQPEDDETDDERPGRGRDPADRGRSDRGNAGGRGGGR